MVHRDPEAHVAYLFRKLSRMLRAARSAPDAKAVHQLRTTIRRIETLAASFGQQETKPLLKFQKSLTDIFERAGRVRDVDVQLEALATISLPSVEDDKKILQNFLQRQRGKRQRKLIETVEEHLEKRLPKRQRRAKAAILASVKKGEASNAAVDLKREIAPLVEKLRTHHFDTETLHELRLDVKHVRYAAETAGAAGDELVAILKPIQDVIGIWHDWITLIETADKALGPLPGHPLMTILRSKVRGRFNDAVTALKSLDTRLVDVMQISKRPGPVLLMPEQASAASAG